MRCRQCGAPIRQVETEWHHDEPAEHYADPDWFEEAKRLRGEMRRALEQLKEHRCEADAGDVEALRTLKAVLE